ncbi:hypothetical protein LIER_22659 [Lithospermum erythrorhizon]|uniref:Uncharacterized protein n=1 Tax=Lithospermum erythrorhizon TaxID=34254 RepID=A0AAV3QY40_LITER
MIGGTVVQSRAQSSEQFLPKSTQKDIVPVRNNMRRKTILANVAGFDILCDLLLESFPMRKSFDIVLRHLERPAMSGVVVSSSNCETIPQLALRGTWQPWKEHGSWVGLGKGRWRVSLKEFNGICSGVDLVEMGSLDKGPCG